MNRLVLAAAFIVASPAFAQTATTVKEVEVSVDAEAMKNAEAAAYWSEVADDLETAIVSRVTDRVAEDGVSISVDLSEVELATAFQNAFDVAVSRMVGRVDVKSDTDDGVFYGYELSVTIDEATPFFPEDFDAVNLSSDTTVYYNSMIEAFADGVVKRIK